NPTAVKFGTISAAISSSSDTQIVTVIPPTAITGKISVTTLDGTATSAIDFIVIKPPTIASFTPALGAVGATITVNGTNLSSVTEVKINDTIASPITPV